jgi:exodeoxyribonuclease VII small subunit
VAAKDNETPISTTADSNALTDIDLTDIAGLNYEQARDELVSIVAQLEGGQIGLEDSMSLWQRGEALATHCNTWLDGAEAKLTTGSEAKRTEQD